MLSNMASMSPNLVTPLPMNEQSIMRKLNFTDEMYDFISMETGSIGPGSGVPCVDAFHSIGQSYKQVHGYIALPVCVFGTAANILNLMILTRKDMRTPINLILSALALVDVLVMIEYMIFAFTIYIRTGASVHQFSYPWAVYVLFHSHFTQILHTMAIQLTLTMAVWRYVAIRFTNQYQVNVICSFRRCYMAIAASFLFPLFICIPNYLTFSIVQRRTWTFAHSPSLPAFLRYKEARQLETLLSFCTLIWPNDVASCRNKIMAKEDFVVDLSDLAKERGGLLHIIHFWTYSVVVKLLPCVILTFFMVYLLHALYAAKQRHRVLQLSSAIPLTPLKTPPRSCDTPYRDQLLSNGPPLENGHLTPPTRVVFNEKQKSCLTMAVDEVPEGEKGGRSSHAQRRWCPGWRRTSSPLDDHSRKVERRSERTSRMLVAVLCLFVLTELPQGVMAFLSGLYGAEFFRKCYNAFAEIWDLLALVNSAVNFLLYCFMSKLFRVHFREIFRRSICFRGAKSPEASKSHQKHTVLTTLL